jgi:hypothetical protein
MGVGRASSSSKNLVNFTVKLPPIQLQYLESLAEEWEASTEASALREVLEQFQRWFSLPVYQREALQKDVAERKVNILRYIQELLARRYEELARGRLRRGGPQCPRLAPGDPAPWRQWRCSTSAWRRACLPIRTR